MGRKHRSQPSVQLKGTQAGVWAFPALQPSYPAGVSGNQGFNSKPAVRVHSQGVSRVTLKGCANQASLSRPILWSSHTLATGLNVAVFQESFVADGRTSCLLPEQTGTRPADRVMITARLLVGSSAGLRTALRSVCKGKASMDEAVGPVYGVLVATPGTRVATTDVYELDLPKGLRSFQAKECMELWGLHNPSLVAPSELTYKCGPTGPLRTVQCSEGDRLTVVTAMLHAAASMAMERHVRCVVFPIRPRVLYPLLKAECPVDQVIPVKMVYPNMALDAPNFTGASVAYGRADEMKAWAAAAKAC